MSEKENKLAWRDRLNMMGERIARGAQRYASKGKSKIKQDFAAEELFGKKYDALTSAQKELADRYVELHLDGNDNAKDGDEASEDENQAEQTILERKRTGLA